MRATHTHTHAVRAIQASPQSVDPLHDGSMASRALLQAYAASIGAVLFETSAKQVHPPALARKSAASVATLLHELC